MKLPAALLCSISVAALAGAAPAADGHACIHSPAAFAQDTTVRQHRADTAARTPTPPRRRVPKHPPRYCPACGMG